MLQQIVVYLVWKGILRLFLRGVLRQPFRPWGAVRVGAKVVCSSLRWDWLAVAVLYFRVQYYYSYVFSHPPVQWAGRSGASWPNASSSEFDHGRFMPHKDEMDILENYHLHFISVRVSTAGTSRECVHARSSACVGLQAL